MRKKTTWLGLFVGTLMLAGLLPDVASAQGTYVGMIQEGVVAGSAAGPGGRARRARLAGAPNIQIRASVTSLSTQAEMQALRGSGSMPVLLSRIRSYNHGTVSVGGRSFPIHAAFLGPNGQVTIFTTSNILGAVGPMGNGAAAMSLGILTLNPTQSQGALFTTTQLLGWRAGFPAARGGRSRISAIRGVQRL